MNKEPAKASFPYSLQWQNNTFEEGIEKLISSLTALETSTMLTSVILSSLQSKGSLDTL